MPKMTLPVTIDLPLSSATILFLSVNYSAVGHSLSYQSNLKCHNSQSCYLFFPAMKIKLLPGKMHSRKEWGKIITCSSLLSWHVFVYLNKIFA